MQAFATRSSRNNPHNEAAHCDALAAPRVRPARIQLPYTYAHPHTGVHVTRPRVQAESRNIPRHRSTEIDSPRRARGGTSASHTSSGSLHDPLHIAEQMPQHACRPRPDSLHQPHAATNATRTAGVRRERPPISSGRCAVRRPPTVPPRSVSHQGGLGIFRPLPCRQHMAAATAAACPSSGQTSSSRGCRLLVVAVSPETHEVGFRVALNASRSANPTMLLAGCRWCVRCQRETGSKHV